ncbi:hypothetical protein FRC08_012004 [Ceratobasidium sp. 394]|nr:hypothetical protein FRC08_012004 [Ceratobasidium sp. 394]
MKRRLADYMHDYDDEIDDMLLLDDTDDVLITERIRVTNLIVVILVLAILRHRGSPAQKRRRTMHLRRPELMPNPHADSPWQSLYRSKEDSSFIITMGVDVQTFEYLLDAGFEHTWNTRPITRDDVNPRGASRIGARSLDAAGGLGLLLHYLCSTVGETGLQMIFAVVPSTLSRYVNFAMRILLKVLKHVPEAEIGWSTPEEMARNSEIINQRHPLIDGAFGFLDGLNLPVAESSDPFVQNANYNGWLHSHKVSNAITFAPDGTIVAAVINSPGSWHDSRVAQEIYLMLLDETPDNYFLIADTAFEKLGRGPRRRIVTPLKRNSRVFNRMTNEEKERAKTYSNAITSARQAVEWGMRAIQGSFGRLRMPLDANNHEGRAWLIELCFRLHNVRTTLVGINQIRTVYLPVWTGGLDDFLEHMYASMFPQIRRNDRIRRYYYLGEND